MIRKNNRTTDVLAESESIRLHESIGKWIVTGAFLPKLNAGSFGLEWMPTYNLKLRRL